MQSIVNDNSSFRININALMPQGPYAPYRLGCVFLVLTKLLIEKYQYIQTIGAPSINPITGIADNMRAYSNKLYVLLL